ncbi:PQQ-dependent dehydrogenase, methanol/ethanol family [Novosphingobium flavum]|uniref:PQQ-dependent dehydrogenase, methanol/ethanol family n=1 Tax=Novosphingobium flavum TaxID=1778672 RepID=A0A7X1FUD1_9SPHN|nr:PQQ-dependent dehydrogenase, methanol/ethanol family [Novosphingobium flavum]MBC2667160.1 PQQ-dependent dehydrogenase, methanol/ethanol family [Novosphingobium flavum]
MHSGFRAFPAWRAILRTAALAPLVAAGLSAAPFPSAAQVDDRAMVEADRRPGEWMGYGRTYDEQRFSPLDQINAGNVSALGLAWYADLGSTRGLEATPLMVDGVVYTIQPWNITTAFDARTGRKLWQYDPKVPERFGRLACCDIVTRGLAAWKGKIYLATLDGRLIALDAKTGAPVWSTEVFDDGQPFAQVITGAPRVFDGKVLIGNSGAEAAARGYATAYDAETGRKLWRFYLVPGDPAKRGAEPANQAAADAISAPTWRGKWWELGGGGTPWDSIVYDPKLRLVYIGGGNGGPRVWSYRSPGGGDNLFLASIVAVNVDTGAYVWHYQQNPGEEWDYTATQPMILADLKIGGRLRHTLIQAPKNGFFYVLDRATGKLISAKPYAPVNWASGIDMKTGRPIMNPAARYGEKPFLLTPNAAHNWYPMAFSPKTGLAYFPVTENYRILAVDPAFRLEPGEMSQIGTSLGGPANAELARQLEQTGRANVKSYLLAWDPVRQREAWRVPMRGASNGGTLATAGNLVFEGTSSATFAAFDARSGARLWEMPVQQIPIAAPITYAIDGVQYVAINAGYGGGVAHDNLSGPSVRIGDYGRLLVFKLGGTAKLPPLVDVPTTLSPPPDMAYTMGDVKAGEALFAQNCAVCHGDNARGGIKDLRKMSPQTHAEFLDIVLGGKRAKNGMAPFTDKLTPAQAQLVHKYLVARAREDWAEIKREPAP